MLFSYKLVHIVTLSHFPRVQLIKKHCSSKQLIIDVTAAHLLIAKYGDIFITDLEPRQAESPDWKNLLKGTA